MEGLSFLLEQFIFYQKYHFCFNSEWVKYFSCEKITELSLKDLSIEALASLTGVEELTLNFYSYYILHNF